MIKIYERDSNSYIIFSKIITIYLRAGDDTGQIDMPRVRRFFEAVYPRILSLSHCTG